MPLDLGWVDEGSIADFEDLHMESRDLESADFVQRLNAHFPLSSF